MRIAVVGVGNIGLNLLRSLRRAGRDAVGVEISPGRRAELAALHVEEICATPAAAGPVDVWLLATSTGPDLSHLLGAVAAIEPRPGALISVESTLPVGSMERLAAHVRARGYTIGHDVFLVHVPHRILFGVEESVFDAPRVIAGITPACMDRGMAFYSPLIEQLLPVATVRTAELCKIVENACRFVEDPGDRQQGNAGPQAGGTAQ